ncbi:Aspartic proteinase CDR1 [Camellia lanceoleosa]|uniref:Aspartic proteinase CDR1 n=1 Tax=Camellia lanceoleosa TaxID=1840588 RepID=A0ACC0FPH8_9ERIC|nr:Aspartic proteinase CDR1 [Camellia lanceoleosa]
MATIFNSYAGFYLLAFFCFIQLSVLNYPIAAQTSGSSFGGGGFNAKLIHRDSPLSPLYNPSTNKLNRLVNSFRRLFSRASHLKQTLKSSTDGIQSQIVYADGEYVMKLSVGTPPVPLFGIVDTGGDLTWTQCKPCTQCFKEKLPYFNPKQAFINIQRVIVSVTIFINHLAAKTFTFESSTDGRAVPIPIMVFGCGHNDEGTFNETATGIVGLGDGKLSFVSQLKHSIHGKFSYCLPPLDSSLSKTKLIFGDNAVVSGVGVISTPITKKSTDTFYYLTLEGIKVGNKSLTYTTPSKANLVDQGNIIIDSGTTLTLLPNELYEKLESELKKVITENRTSDPLGTSWRASVRTPVLLPKAFGVLLGVQQLNHKRATRTDIGPPGKEITANKSFEEAGFAAALAADDGDLSDLDRGLATELSKDVLKLVDDWGSQNGPEEQH